MKDAYDLSFYEFDDEKDPKEYGVLLCDVVHGRPPMKPTYIGIGWYWYYHGIRYGADTLSLPTTHGWDSRFVNGYPYISAIRTTAEEARAERAPLQGEDQSLSSKISTGSGTLFEIRAAEDVQGSEETPGDSRNGTTSRSSPIMSFSLSSSILPSS